MNWKIVNESVHVGGIRIKGVSGSSVVLVGDTDKVVLASMFDTPPESVIVGVDTVGSPSSPSPPKYPTTASE